MSKRQFTEAMLASSRTNRVAAMLALILLTLSFLLTWSPYSSYASNPASATTPTPTPVATLSNLGDNATNPMVGSVGSHVYVAWSEAAGGIKFRNSSDSGADWFPPLLSPATTISNQSAAGGYGPVQFPVMYANQSDVFIAWSQTFGKIGLQIFEATSINNGTTFVVSQLTNTNGESLTTKGGYITPAIAASGPNVYITFCGNGSKAYVMSSNNFGLPGSWGRPFLYSTSLEVQVAAYGKTAYAIADHDVSVTHDGGSTWKAILPSKVFHGDEPMIAMWGNYVYVVTELPNGTNRADTYIRVYYSDHAQTATKTSDFGKVVDLSPAQNDSWAPMVGAFGSSAWIAFRTYPGGAKGTIWEYTTNNGGLAWIPVGGNALSGSGKQFNTKGTAETFPFEVVSTDGHNVFVGWSHEVKTGYWRFMVSGSTDGGAHWSAPPGINMSQNSKGEAGFEIDLANAAISSAGPTCYAVWQYVLGKTTQVQFASVTI